MRNLYFYQNKSTLTLIILLSISLGAMFFNPKLENLKLSKLVFFVTYPFEYAINGMGGFFTDTFSGISKIKKLESELAETKERLNRYQEKLLLYSEIVKENKRLKKTLEIKKNINYDTKYANIIFRDPSLQGDYFIINKGRLDHLRPNMPVVSYDTNGKLFLVGKTTEVSLMASKVRLLTAGNFMLGVTLQDSGYIGILQGNGSWNQDCIVHYITVEANAYIGQKVVTSGESDIFPYGLLVGTVVAKEKNVMEEFFQNLYVRPEYDYSRLKDVFVIEWQSGQQVKQLTEDSYEQ